jgi:hypothetical protein
VLNDLVEEIFFPSTLKAVSNRWQAAPSHPENKWSYRTGALRRTIEKDRNILLALQLPFAPYECLFPATLTQ